ncbi:MAG: hypothetical protein R3F59_23300 [Myxococcota bacterium]
MVLRPLGRTGLEVAPSASAPAPSATPPLPDADAEALIELALDLGLRLVDTAPSYGASEAAWGASRGGAAATSC